MALRTGSTQTGKNGAGKKAAGRKAGGRRARKRSSKKNGRSVVRRWLSRALLLAVPAAVLALGWFLWPLWKLSAQFGATPTALPTRIYAAAPELGEGDRIGRHRVIERLDLAGYRKVTDDRALTGGRYRVAGDSLHVALRSFPTPRGWSQPGKLEVRFSGQRIRSLRFDEQPVRRIAVEPPLLGSFFGRDHKDRRPVDVEQLPEHVVLAVLAAEDARFRDHSGFSIRGIARAAWVNFQDGGIQQGGSTLTQQLVKNLFLTQERTYTRKLQEVALAVALELRFSKLEILNAYLNEIYWGQSGSVNVMGVGSAARFYFGKDATDLELAESALLAGIIHSPGSYSPVRQPERARERRDWVLERMYELGWLEQSQWEHASAAELGVSITPPVARRAGFFRDVARREAAARFGVTALEDTGYVLLTTLDWWEQERAEEAVGWGLESLEKGWEKDRKADQPLQAALVAIDTQSGGIRSYIGGRDYGRSQFDRAGQAQRQAGSAFKPVVYAAAFESGVASPSTLLEDAPLTVSLAGRKWNPRNSNGTYQGWVSARTAVEKSLNVPTARLAIGTGLSQVVELSRRLGITTDLQALPSLALGSFEVTPRELATVYATLAAGGVRPEVHAVRAVLAPDGSTIDGTPLAAPQRAVSPEVAYLVTSMLEGVLERGTAAGARQMGFVDRLAGKTGTTNDRRDSWFAGYAPDRVHLVWVGYDDNASTQLSGSRAALPIWARYTRAVRPDGGYRTFSPPAGIVTAVIDPETGGLATGACGAVVTEYFQADHVPSQICPRHGRWLAELVNQPDGVRPEKPRRMRKWLKRVFGKKRGGGSR